jgi:hypothetical protein
MGELFAMLRGALKLRRHRLRLKGRQVSNVAAYLIHIRTEVVRIRHRQGLTDFLQRRDRRSSFMSVHRAEVNFPIDIFTHQTYKICSVGDGNLNTHTIEQT